MDIEVEFGPGLTFLQERQEQEVGSSWFHAADPWLTYRQRYDPHRSFLCIGRAFVPGRKQKAEQALNSLGIFTEEGQVLLSRKIMDGRSINKINGETCTVGQMKAAAECLLDIHGQHEHQSLLIRRNSWRSWTHMEEKRYVRQRKRSDSPMRNTANICGL